MAQLVYQPLPTPEDLSLNLVITQYYFVSTVLKLQRKKRPRMKTRIFTCKSIASLFNKNCFKSDFGLSSILCLI